MPHIIVSGCCNDASCVDVCPVDCIHPTPSEDGFEAAEMLFIDPDSCIDCGACVQACPVGAIRPDTETSDIVRDFADLASDYFAGQRSASVSAAPLGTSLSHGPNAPGAPARRDRTSLKIAVVGAGAAGGYAARALASEGADVRIFDENLVPGGLVRFGVAPDHPKTKWISDVLPYGSTVSNIQLYLGVAVGRDITHEELLQHHHYVVYATGAKVDRPLAIPGHDLSRVYAAGDFVRWYNGDPAFHGREFDLTGETAVVIGNGNVALDVARILLSDTATLNQTDASDEAIAALGRSGIRRVEILGRRGLADAAYTVPELMRLMSWSDTVGIGGCAADVQADRVLRGSLGLDLDTLENRKVALAEQLAESPRSPDGPEIRFRWLVSPLEISEAGDRLTIALGRNTIEVLDGRRVSRHESDLKPVEADLVITSLGSQAAPISGVPLDSSGGRISNRDGRVVDPETGAPVDRVYVTGWAKRGANGGLGVNRACAMQTVRHLLDDDQSRDRPEVLRDTAALEELLRQRVTPLLDRADWHRLDRSERGAGDEVGRPRVKLTSRESILDELVRR